MTKLTEEQIEANRAAIQDPNQTLITLGAGFARGSQTITEVILYKPKGQTLRGLSITSVLQGDVDALIKLVPRISFPSLTEADVGNLDLQDLVKLQMGIVTFLDATQMPALSSPTA